MLEYIYRFQFLFRPQIFRTKLRRATSYLAWPVLAPLARIRRRFLDRDVCVVAVVGSFGKTTTTRALAAAMKCPSVSGRNSWSRLALGMLSLGKTARSAVFEVGVARKGQMHRYARLIQPNVTVVTSIGSEHLLSLKTLEGVRREKAVMVEATDPEGLVVLNGDDPNVMWMKDRTRAVVVTCGFGEENDIRASDLKILWPQGTGFRLDTSAGSWIVNLPLIGRPMVYSALVAVAVGISHGLDIGLILQRLQQLTPAPGRLQPMELSSGAWVLRDDHKSGLETIHAALATLAEIEAPRRVVVMGDITEEIGNVRAIYRSLGFEIGKIADLLLLTGRHSRSMAVGARQAGLRDESIVDCRKDIFKAIDLLEGYLQRGDVVLLKGRHEQRLRRISLALAGRTVNCRLVSCREMGLHCESCSSLSHTWPAGVRKM